MHGMHQLFMECDPYIEAVTQQEPQNWCLQASPGWANWCPCSKSRANVCKNRANVFAGSICQRQLACLNMISSLYSVRQYHTPLTQFRGKLINWHNWVLLQYACTTQVAKWPSNVSMVIQPIWPILAFFVAHKVAYFVGKLRQISVVYFFCSRSLVLITLPWASIGPSV